MQCTTKCWLLAMNQYFHPLCHYASPWCPSFMFSKTQTNPPQEKRLQKSGHCKLFLFFRIVNINIKTKFREPISLGLEAISLTLFASKIHPGRRVASCGELSKMIFSGQLLGTSPGVKCLAG